MQNKIYPFKFLDAYTAEDKEIFFGRDEEVRQLYQMIYQSDTLLLYGASGTGKTSLIQCGLASQFEQHDWLDIFVRRHKNINESLNKALLAVGGEGKTNPSLQEQDLDWLDDLMGETGQTTIARQALSPVQTHLKNIYLQHFRPIYLIFDQFEELFILGTKTEQQQFIQTVQEILQVEQPVKLIFSIREEYLGELYELEKAVPALLRKKLRIDPMNLEKVKAVVVGATTCPQSIVHIQEEEADAIAEQVFERIRGRENTLTIQLPYLQVFLDKFYRHISKDTSKHPTTEATFTLDALSEIGDINDILRDFLDEQIVEIAKKQSSDHKTIWKILSPFVTVDGTKEPISLVGLHQQLPDIDDGLTEQVVFELMNRRILRYNEEEELYEIAHDSLALRIAEKRSDDDIALLEVRHLIKSQSQLKNEAQELFSAKQLDFIEPYLSKIVLSKEEEQLIQKSRQLVLQKENEARRNKLMFIGLTILIITVILMFAISAKQQQQLAEKANERNLKIVNAMDFYDDKYALAVNDGLYGFINKDGEPVIDYKYKSGTPFDPETGFAIVELEIEDYAGEESAYEKRRPTNRYFIDTTGQEYYILKVNDILGQEDATLEQVEQYLPYWINYLNAEEKNVALNLSNLSASTIQAVLQTIQKAPAFSKRVAITIISESNLNEFPTALLAFNNLQWLDLSYTSISQLPEELGQLQQLKTLDIRETEITTLPNSIGQLTQLSHLYLPYVLEEVPNSIFNLKQLEILDLTSIQLEAIPSELSQLTQLKTLQLTVHVEQLPDFSALKKLERLQVYSKKLNQLPPNIGTLEKLSILHFSGPFTQIPDNFYQLTQLEHLSFFETEVTDLSEDIGQLSQLQSFYFAGPITTLPSSLFDLKQLRSLGLASKQLTTLPAAVRQLQKLEELSLYININQLPKSITQLKKLKSIFITSNQNIKNLELLAQIENLEALYYIIHKNDSYDKTIAALKTIADAHPNCYLEITAEDGEAIYLDDDYE